MSDERLKARDIINTVNLLGREIPLVRAAPSATVGVVEVQVTDVNDPLQITKAAINEITRTRWWLQDSWKEKGVPKEQIEFSNGDLEVTVYNYWRNLQERELVAIQRILGVFAGISQGVNYDYFRYLMVDDRQPTYNKTGRPQNGVARTDLRTITLFPNAFQMTPSMLTDQASHLEWVLAHEESHGFEDVKLESGRLLDFWQKIGNWHQVDRKNLTGGGISIWDTTEPERCLSELARVDAQEDLAESGAGRIFIPNKVDSLKLQFLEENLAIDRERQNPWGVRIISDVELPKLPDEFQISAIPRRAFLVKSTRGGQ